MRLYVLAFVIPSLLRLGTAATVERKSTKPAASDAYDFVGHFPGLYDSYGPPLSSSN